MGEIIHQSEVTITREKGTVRKAVIKGVDEPIYCGMHGDMKNFYNVKSDEEEHAATLDHVISAVAG